MQDHGRGRRGRYHAGAEEPGMAAGASGWRSGRTQGTTHNDVPKKGDEAFVIDVVAQSRPDIDSSDAATLQHPAALHGTARGRRPWSG